MPFTKNILLLFSSLILITTIARTQNDLFSVTGALQDTSGGVSFATVMLLDEKDSSMSKATLTDENGKFVLSGVQAGNFFLKATSIGLLDLINGPYEIKSDQDLGVIQMKQDTTSLDVLTISAQRPLIVVLPDRMVFNVEGTINATGSNAFDLLRKAPGVIVDNNNNIIVEGKTGVQIYIDGKPSLLAGNDLVNYLKTLQSTDVESIEIIAQPSSRYDAAGNAGIIDIILKKDKNLGMNGSASAFHRYGRNHMSNGSLNLNYRQKKLNVYGLMNGGGGNSWNFMYMERTQEGAIYDSRTETNSYYLYGNARVGADYMPNRFNTIGVLLTGNLNNNVLTAVTTTNITPANSNSIEQQLLANNISDNNNDQFTGNLNYRFKDTSGHEFYFDLDYGRYLRRNATSQPNSYYDFTSGDELFSNDYRMVTPANIDIFTVKMDYSQNMFKGKVGFGGKASFVQTENTFNFYNVYETYDSLNDARSNQFDYTENINAAYVNYSRKWTDKWSTQFGLRAEQTNSQGILTSLQSTGNDSVTRHYLNWFPSGGISFTPSQKHMWSLNFSRRIQRPNYQSLNPFEYQTDELTFDKGNPFLQPQYTNSVRLSHTFNYKITSTIGYSYATDFFAQITDTIGTNKNFMMPRNVADLTTYSVSISYPISIKKWWDLYINLNGTYSDYTANDDKFQPVQVPSFNLYGNNSFSIGKGWRFEVSGWFNSPSIWGGTYLTKSQGALNLAMEKKWLNDNLVCRLAFNDVFFTVPWRADMQYSTIQIRGTGGWESRHVVLNLSYTFGKKEVKAARDRKTGIEEENERVGG